MTAGAVCAFCSASRTLVETAVLDEKWSSRYGGTPVVALDHGWYTSARGERVQADRQGSPKTFRPYVRAACDPCMNGWMEDVRWRAEPTLLALADGQELQPPPRSDPQSLLRWTQLTALLAELMPGMPTASSMGQRYAVHRGQDSTPPVDVWFFAPRQRLPSRVHLSQVTAPVDGGGEGLIQVVSIEMARFCALVVVPGEGVDDVLRRSALVAEFGEPRRGDDRSPLTPRPFDLASTPHPQRVAVQRLCSAAH
jgi:hypothetical protein